MTAVAQLARAIVAGTGFGGRPAPVGHERLRQQQPELELDAVARDTHPHVLAAELRRIADDKIATVFAGLRLGDLTREEAVAYEGMSLRTYQ